MYKALMIPAQPNPHTLMHCVRTTVAAIVSLGVARMCRLPESYWATITTLIVMQSTLGAAWIASTQRLAGTAIGAVMGALASTWFNRQVLVFGVAVFLIGLICLGLRLERNAYRYASITLAIIMLAAQTSNPWILAVHRFIEVAIGIGAALLITAIWPERVVVDPSSAELSGDA